MITGHLQEKNGKLYMIINLKNKKGKWQPKWFSTKLPAKGNKTVAAQMLRDKIRELEELEAAQQEAIKNGVLIPQVLFTDYLAKWLKIIKPQVEETTFTGYRSIIEKQVIPYYLPFELYLGEVQAKHIKGYYDFLMVERGQTANTVKHHHANIRKALQMAMIDDLIPSNPADKVQLPRIKPYLATVYNQEELHELLYCVKDNSLEIPVKMAAYYGLRAGEVCGLRWSCIDFKRKTITINHTIGKITTDDGKHVTVKRNRTKNMASYRTLPLIPEIEKLLLDKKQQTAERKKHFGNSYDNSNSAYVCTGKLGKLLTPGNLSRYFRTLLQRYELKHLRFHDLRHSCASLLLANGISMKEIQDWLGHSSYTTTANIYAHLDSNSKRNSADVMQAILGNATDKDKRKNAGTKEKNIKKNEPAYTQKSA